MTYELAKKRFEYWMQKLDLYEFVECVAAAQDHPQLAAVMKRLGHRIPKGAKLPKQRRTCYVKASDDWFPSYRDGKVAVFFSSKNGGSIGVWGADDFGMEKSPATRREYDEICASVVSQPNLKRRGFTPA